MEQENFDQIITVDASNAIEVAAQHIFPSIQSAFGILEIEVQICDVATSDKKDRYTDCKANLKFLQTGLDTSSFAQRPLEYIAEEIIRKIRSDIFLEKGIKADMIYVSDESSLDKYKKEQGILAVRLHHF